MSRTDVLDIKLTDYKVPHTDGQWGLTTLKMTKTHTYMNSNGPLMVTVHTDKGLGTHMKLLSVTLCEHLT